MSIRGIVRPRVSNYLKTEAMERYVVHLRDHGTVEHVMLESSLPRLWSTSPPRFVVLWPPRERPAPPARHHSPPRPGFRPGGPTLAAGGPALAVRRSGLRGSPHQAQPCLLTGSWPNNRNAV